MEEIRLKRKDLVWPEPGDRMGKYYCVYIRQKMQMAVCSFLTRVIKARNSLFL